MGLFGPDPIPVTIVEANPEMGLAGGCGCIIGGFMIIAFFVTLVYSIVAGSSM